MAGGNTYDDDWRWGAKKDDIDGGSTYDDDWRWGEKNGDDGWRWALMAQPVYIFFTALMRVLITALIRSQLKPQ